MHYTMQPNIIAFHLQRNHFPIYLKGLHLLGMKFVEKTYVLLFSSQLKPPSEKEMNLHQPLSLDVTIKQRPTQHYTHVAL